MSANLARQGLVLYSVFIAACSNLPSEYSGDVYAQLPQEYAITDLPFYPQIEDQCGPASLATMLSARDVLVSPESLRDKIYIPGKQGSLTTEMVARARRYGMLVYPLAPELSDILTEISAGNPVLVMQNLGYDWLPKWHFSVVIAYNLEQNTITLRTGTAISHEISFDLFLTTWGRAQRWAVVITKPGQMPATARETIYLNAANELELVNEFQAALTAFETALAQWPQSSLAYFGAGNAAYSLGRFSRAQEWYSLYLQLEPRSPDGWNNLAYSLMALNCKSQSLDAIDCAVALAPENKNLLDSQVALSKKSQDDQSSACMIVSC